MIEAVLWDVDDTIFDFTGSERTGLLRHFEAEGLPSDEAALERWHRIAEAARLRLTAGRLTYEEYRRVRVRTFVGRPLSDIEADAWHERYEALFAAAWSAFPDAASALAALPHRQGILSNSSTVHQERRLTALGLRHHFEVLLCSDRLGCEKPDPRAFQAACAALKLPPARIAYVGDKLDVDAEGARNAGLHAIWLDRAETATPTPAGIHRISTLTEVSTLLAAC
ncbi:HAD family hydrolase [Actinomadura sp. NPDC048032]|uniref:HAD family hydrolase n=1 Tax=Actinomadura sp. NPDC048032 TaxID=3155747 RepID=UPI0033EAD782